MSFVIASLPADLAFGGLSDHTVDVGMFHSNVKNTPILWRIAAFWIEVVPGKELDNLRIVLLYRGPQLNTFPKRIILRAVREYRCNQSRAVSKNGLL
jgi:hypothetical protein